MANPQSGSNAVFGSASTTTSTATTVVTATEPGKRIFVTDLELGNSSATGVAVTLNDGASTVIWVPASTTITKSFETPLRFPANTAVTFTPAAATSTAYCAAQGYTSDGGLV